VITPTETLPSVADWPLYWFATLERAIERGELQAAAEAQQQLARLGVRVAFDLHRAPGKVVAHAE
jgi:hypothetical protein